MHARSRSDRSLKTFVVEDNPLIRQNLISTLEELACVVVTGSADNEADAVAQLAAPADPGCDLVILDLVLKQGTGLGVLARMAALGRAGRCVVLSNYATRDVAARALALGAARVFDKSTDIDALLDYCHTLAEPPDERLPRPPL